MTLPAAREEQWTPKALWRLIWPLVVEQLLLISIGMADTMMVTVAGEAAVSGIALVDAINILFINVFSALATGGAVVASQYLGRKDPQNASRAAGQLMLSILGISLALMVVTLVLRRPILQLIYGHIDEAVMEGAEADFLLSAISYPFMAAYNAGAALFRSMGNSKVGMLTSLMVNLVNIGGNALLIFGFGWGVVGAATSTLVSRILAMLVVVGLLLRPGAGPVTLRGFKLSGRDRKMSGRIYKIGLPNAVENSTFQVGKLLVARIISTFGTSAIAGNAVAQNLATFCNITGMALGLATITVVGQCIGAKDYDAAKRNARRLTLTGNATMLLMGGLVLLVHRPVLSIFNLSPTALETAHQCLVLFCAFVGFFWPTSFLLPNALRAAGDARYTLAVSMFSMWVFRIGSAFLFAYGLGYGVLGVWIAMIVDWVVRSVFFLVRWRRGRWQSIRVIDSGDRE